MSDILSYFSLVPSELPYIAFGFLFAFLLAALLSKCLFGPFRDLVEAREDKTTGALANAQSLNLKANEFEELVKERLALAQIEGSKQALRRVLAAREQANGIISKAEILAESIVREAKTDLHQVADIARQSCSANMPKLVDDAFSKLFN